MMNIKQSSILSLATLAGFVVPHIAIADTSEHTDNARFEKDRVAILAMAGDYQVTFRFDETITYDPDSKPSKRHVSRGYETVRILADTGKFIQLQHILVVEGGEDTLHVVKHWRQDWTYEAAEYLAYRGKRDWERVSVPASEQKNTWTQTVYQVDDSPRYAGYGQWVHIGDQSYWESNETWRPLPRREEKQRDDYDVLVGTNRHSLTPEGWAHEQDNYKLALNDGGEQLLAREIGRNSYNYVSDFDFTVANEYWNDTHEFWSVIRSQWATLIEKHKSLHIADEVEGKKLYSRVMPIAEKFREDESHSLKPAIAAFESELSRYLN